MRWEIEGEWTGYTPAQRRVVYREVTNRLKFAEAVRNIGHGIRYTDGTMLLLTVRRMSRGELHKPDIRGYDKLIRQCIDEGVSSVMDLKPSEGGVVTAKTDLQRA